MNTSTQAVDAIVIGAGQAGPPMAARCAREGLNTVLVERGALGGTCVNNGCVPTKAWVASARAAQVARRAAEWGVVIEAPVRVDMAAVRARKDRIIAHSHQALAKWLGNTANLRVMQGEARFTAPRTVQVGEALYSAPRIFLNLGGAPLRPARRPGTDRRASALMLGTILVAIGLLGASGLASLTSSAHR